MDRFYRWFIEVRDEHDIHSWWTGMEWTQDPHIAKGFDTEQDAADYHQEYQSFIGNFVLFTEHEFSSPVKTPHTLN